MAPTDILSRIFAQPWVSLVPRIALVLVLTGTLGGIHIWLLMPAQARLSQLEGDWSLARKRLVQHVEAKRIQQDLDRVLKSFPVKKDFVPLALGITDEAKRNRVTLPSLSYKVQKSPNSLAAKAVFQGSVTGRYEDLRRFIHQLELAEEFLFIEDLDVVRSGKRQGRVVTFNMRVVTYLRNHPVRDSKAS